MGRCCPPTAPACGARTPAVAAVAGIPRCRATTALSTSPVCDPRPSPSCPGPLPSPWSRMALHRHGPGSTRRPCTASGRRGDPQPCGSALVVAASGAAAAFAALATATHTHLPLRLPLLPDAACSAPSCVHPLVSSSRVWVPWRPPYCACVAWVWTLARGTIGRGRDRGRRTCSCRPCHPCSMSGPGPW